MTETQEFVVPRSIPITLAIVILSFKRTAGTHSGVLLAAPNGMVFTKARHQPCLAAYIRSPPDDCKTLQSRKARKISALMMDEAIPARNVVGFPTGVKGTKRIRQKHGAIL
jgi:hypothetical protein